MPRTISVTILAVLLGGCATAGRVTEAADAALDDSVFSLSVGTCFDDPDDLAEEIQTVDDVPCSSPHDNEVFALFDLSEDTYSAELVADVAFEGCVERFEAYVDRPYLESELEVFTITPTAASWEDGDREVICSLYALDLSKLTGSMAGSGR